MEAAPGTPEAKGSDFRVLSCLLTLHTSVISFEILLPFGLVARGPGWFVGECPVLSVSVCFSYERPPLSCLVLSN